MKLGSPFGCPSCPALRPHVRKPSVAHSTVWKRPAHTPSTLPGRALGCRRRGANKAFGGGLWPSWCCWLDPHVHTCTEKRLANTFLTAYREWIYCFYKRMLILNARLRHQNNNFFLFTHNFIHYLFYKPFSHEKCWQMLSHSISKNIKTRKLIFKTTFLGTISWRHC